MVDIFALALSHGLLALVAWRLLMRPELDDEGEPSRASRRSADPTGEGRNRQKGMRWPADPSSGGESDGVDRA